MLAIYNINLVMIKEAIVPANETVVDQPDKTNPFDKLIVSEQLSYLPNLYLRQYKAVDELVRLRQDFPQQRILVQRSYTKWDGVLDEMRFRSKIIAEEKKYKIVQRSQIAKQVKLEVQRKQLRNEQCYQYHRLTSSYLSQGVVNIFQQQSRAMIEEVKIQVKEEQLKAMIIKQNQDDIFVQKGDEYYDMPEQNNLLDDLLNDPIPEKKQEYIEAQEVNVEPISTYLSAKFGDSRQQIQKEPRVSISRKMSLKRINENVRRRLKIKQEQEQQAGRSLSSATVFLSSLLNSQHQSRSRILIELPNKTEWLFSSERPRKKKDEETFELRWSAEQLELFEQRNEKYSWKKGKIDNNILVMNISGEQQYKKYFEKNIATDKSFPPTIHNIPTLKIEKTKKYYNQFHDIQYQEFIRKYNKRNIFKQFAQKAGYLFPQNYSSEEFSDVEGINAGKIFVHPPEKVLDRIVYKISDYKLGVSVKNDFTHLKLDLNQMIILTFFVKKYIKKFGNDWKSITKFIEMNPIFSNHHITQEIVQQVYQLIGRYQDHDSLTEINLWDKKILPFDYYSCYSYAQFNSTMYHKQPYQLPKMEAQNQNTDDQYPHFDLEDYGDLIYEDPQQSELSQLSALEDQYRAFAKPIFEKIMKTHEHNYLVNRQDKFQKIQQIYQKYQESTEKFAYLPQDRDKRQNLGKILEEALSMSKAGDIKTVYPFRKKKNINERNNQLVKILQALRNKNVNPQNPNNPKKLDDGKPFPQPTNPVKPSPTPTASVPQTVQSKPSQVPADKKTPAKPVEKTGQKRLGAPSKKDRKKDEDKNK